MVNKFLINHDEFAKFLAANKITDVYIIYAVRGISKFIAENGEKYDYPMELSIRFSQLSNINIKAGRERGIGSLVAIRFNTPVKMIYNFSNQSLVLVQ